MTISPSSTEKYKEIKETISSLGLHTVCAEAHCPNINECWGGGTATFMVLGSLCTRGCRFCAVSKMAKGESVDASEPEKLAIAIKEWGLDYVVITSVCRDDLPDQGSSHFARCVEEIKKENKNTMVELLIPDFHGDEECIGRIANSKPHVIGHNIETVERISPSIRDRRASYGQSLFVLEKIKKMDKSIYTKSAIMLGMGESEEETIQSMKDLRSVDVDFLAIGQYLRPSQKHAEVKEYITPEKFNRFKGIAMDLGFKYVAAGPFVRSSYRAGEYFMKMAIEQK